MFYFHNSNPQDMQTRLLTRLTMWTKSLCDKQTSKMKLRFVCSLWSLRWFFF